MQNDASSAGVKRGGLVNTAEIKILICYILSSVSQPVCGNDLAEILHHEGIANYFEVDNAISELKANGSILLVEGTTDTYTASAKGADAAKTLKTTLPYTIRQKAYNLTVKMLATARNYAETKFSIEQREKGCIISCSAYDHDLELLTVRIAVADEQQARNVKERFVSNPGAVCRKIINYVLDNKEE